MTLSMQAPSYRGSRNALCVGKVDDALNLGTVTIGSDENNKGTMRAHGCPSQADPSKPKFACRLCTYEFLEVQRRVCPGAKSFGRYAADPVRDTHENCWYGML